MKALVLCGSLRENTRGIAEQTGPTTITVVRGHDAPLMLLHPCCNVDSRVLDALADLPSVHTTAVHGPNEASCRQLRERVASLDFRGKASTKIYMILFVGDDASVGPDAIGTDWRSTRRTLCNRMMYGVHLAVKHDCLAFANASQLRQAAESQGTAAAAAAAATTTAHASDKKMSQRGNLPQPTTEHPIYCLRTPTAASFNGCGTDNQNVLNAARHLATTAPDVKCLARGRLVDPDALTAAVRRRTSWANISRSFDTSAIVKLNALACNFHGRPNVNNQAGLTWLSNWLARHNTTQFEALAHVRANAACGLRAVQSFKMSPEVPPTQTKRKKRNRSRDSGTRKRRVGSS